MPKVKRTGGEGYGCTCPSFKREPDPLAVIKAFARSVGWKGEPVQVWKEGTDLWSATSDNVTFYTVTYSPDAPGGFCKHVVGVEQKGWLKVGCVGAKEVLEELDRVTKELRKMTKERDKWKKISKNLE